MLAQFGYTPNQMLDLTMREVSNLIKYHNEDRVENIKLKVACAGGDPNKVFPNQTNPYKKESVGFKNQEKLDNLYNNRKKFLEKLKKV